MTSQDARKIESRGELLQKLRSELGRRVVGQSAVIEELFIALLSEGHCLIIGVPGLAKTLLVSSLAELLKLSFKRIQFTPDLMPNDITGASLIVDDAQAASRSERSF